MVDIREYKIDDEEKIVSLFNEVFKENRNLDYWNWQFLKNPIKKPIIVLGEDYEKIIGQCTLLPTKIMINNKEVYAGQSIDTMIHKDYRGQGLHKILADKTYQIGIENNIKVRIGFPSEDALRGLLGSIGGSYVKDIPIYMSIYRLENFVKSIVKIDFLAKLLSVLGTPAIKFLFREKKIKTEENYKVKEIKEFNQEFDEFWNKIKKNSPLMSVRNSKFLNWRIKNHPKIKYKTYAAYLDGEMKGYMICKIEDKEFKGNTELQLGSIVDMVGENQEVLACLYNEVKKYFESKKVDFVAAWGNDFIGQNDLLEKTGFRKSKSKISFVVKSLAEDKELEEIIIKEENWYLMPIESDFY